MAEKNGWTCSVCGKEPKIMHSTEPNICADCFDKTEPGPAPHFTGGERVSTPDGEGVVNYVQPGENERDSAVSVFLDALASTKPGYRGTLYLAEYVKEAPKRRRR
jgi:hypothetical protein